MACGLVFAISACTPLPDIAARNTEIPPGPTPAILPLDALLAQGSAANTPGDPAADLAARAASLRARARALRDQTPAPGA